MENEYLDTDFAPTDTLQEDSLEHSQEDDRGIVHTAPKYCDDEPWFNEELLTNSTPSDSPILVDDSDNKWTTAGESSNDNQQSEDGQEQYDNYRSAISFRGYGRCECGCGSFGGHGSICSYCGHPYSAHSRYKK